MTSATNPPTEGPNFVVAGAARSGTTALMRALGSHREVFVTEPKEVHFFSHAGRPTAYRGPGDDDINRTIISEPSEFSRLFDGVEEPARGEGSVSTLYFPERSIPALRRYADPDCRVVVIVREPAARSHSAYLYLRSRGAEDESFEAALEAEPDRRRSGYHHMWHYRAMSRYERQLPAFADEFGDGLHLIVWEELRADPAAEMRRLCRFLDVDPDVDFDLGTPVNLGGVPRSRVLTAAMNTARRSPAVRTAVKRTVGVGLMERIRAVHLARPEREPVAVTPLRTSLRDARECVEDLLGRHVDAWDPPH